MNRKIQFRVWDIKQNKFLPSYGNLGINFYHEQGDSWHKKQIKDIIPVSWFLQDHNNSLGNFIVQQFTGLLDSDNREIYEGDIIVEKWIELDFCRDGYGIIEPFSIEKYTRTYKVIYMSSQFNIENQLSGKKTKKDFERKVVGNIYENPELLTK